MKLQVSKANTEFINPKTGGYISLEHAVTQINKGNKNYKDYRVVNRTNGTAYIRSKADERKNNNIEV